MITSIKSQLSQEETIPAGAQWSTVLKRNQVLRIRDMEGGANVGIMMYRFENTVDRMSIPDTLKQQRVARLTKGNVIFSDLGHVLASIIEDTCGWHDPLGGNSNRKSNCEKYGPSSYQKDRNGYNKNGRDNCLIELGKWGMGKEDQVALINFFSKVQVDKKGVLSFVPNNSKSGDYIELRAEMNTLIILHTCPHPLNPSKEYYKGAVGLKIWQGQDASQDDVCRNYSSETQRGFILTEALFSDRGLFIESKPQASKNVIPEGVEDYKDEKITYVESKNDPSTSIYNHTILSGEGWMHKIKAGQTFRIVDVEGNEAADCLFFNANKKEDFYSMQDTIRSQNAVYLSTGSKLISSDGNVMMTITADTCGRHDTLGGCCSQESNQCRYDIEKKHMHACRQTFLLEMAEYGHGYGKKNIAHNINFFMNVPLTTQGQLYFDDGVSFPGRYVEMKANMDVVCLISNCPQLNNPCCGYNPTPLQVLLWDESYSSFSYIQT